MTQVFQNPTEALRFIKAQQESAVKTLRVKCYADSTCSYFHTSHNICKELLNCGAAISIPDDREPVNLIHGPMDWVAQHQHLLHNDLSIAYVMHETTRFNPKWAYALHCCKAVVVPSMWGASCFNAQGVERPIHVVPLGHSERFEHRRISGEVVFGSIMSDVWRKNLPLLLKAFSEVPGPARLKIKIPEHLVPVQNDPRVTFYTKQMSYVDLQEWKADCDFGIFPSAGEGFGLGHLEFAAIGRPVIYSNFGPPTEWLPYVPSLSIPGSVRPASGKYSSGLWFWPDFEGLKFAISNAMVLGSPQQHELYCWIANDFRVAAAPLTWNRTAHALLNVFKSEGIYQ